jgi:hypothetical protein
MGPITFKDPSLIGTYHRAPSLIHPLDIVFIISSNGTNTRDTIPPTEASSLPNIPLVIEFLPQESLENSPTPLVFYVPLP